MTGSAEEPAIATFAPTTEGAAARQAIVRLAPGAMARLGLRPGETIELIGAGSTLARVMPSTGQADQDAIRVPPDLATIAGTGPDGRVTVRPVDLPPARSVHVSAEDRLPPGCDLAALLENRPLAAGDRVAGGSGMPALLIERLEPGDRAIVTADTQIHVLNGRMARDGAFPGVGGLAEQTARVREMIALPLRRPELFARLGLEPPRGVLFTGPPGTGKTLLARALAEGVGASFHAIDGPEIVTKHYGESEGRLRSLFERAARAAPAIVFIDEIDAIAPRRDGLSEEKQLERRIVAQLLTLMDGLKPRSGVTVVAATNMADSLEPALRRPGRFEREIRFGPPDRRARREILGIHLAEAPLAPGIDLDTLARETPGFVGADLAALAREAGMAAARRLDEQPDAGPVRVEPADIALARTRVGPTALRGATSEIPETRWSDVGGLDALRERLTEALAWPLAHREAHEALGLRPAAGVLLSGPPGSGKTLVARAIAGECGFNFVAVEAGRLLSPFLGETERRLADLFARARDAGPAILFFDEIDALAPVRGQSDPALARLVSCLLAHVDGIAGRGEIALLGATNRPDAVDPALLRPGRFDLVLPVPLPDRAARRAILSLHCRGRSLAPDADPPALADRTEGWSGAALAALCDAAARSALARTLRSGDDAPPRIGAADLEAALAAGIASARTLTEAGHAPAGAAIQKEFNP